MELGLLRRRAVDVNNLGLDLATFLEVFCHKGLSIDGLMIDVYGLGAQCRRAGDTRDGGPSAGFSAASISSFVLLDTRAKQQ